MGSQASKTQSPTERRVEVVNEKSSVSQPPVHLCKGDEPEFESLNADILDKWSDDFDKAQMAKRVILDRASIKLARVDAGFLQQVSLPLRDSLLMAANVLRYNVIEQLKLGDFELSQNYLFFYDKLEKANYFLDRLDSLLTSKLREYAVLLRAASAQGGSLRKMKSTFLAEVFSTLTIALGSPPKPTDQLTWEYYDKDNKFHSWTGTPRDFYAQYGKRKGMDPADSFSLINDPRNQYERLYSVERLGNVWNGKPVRCIKANTPLFFGCDVGKASNTPEGVMDCDVYDISAAYGFTLGMNKAQRLETGESSMTHAMVITAVHLDASGRPVRYKVENSWSDTAGEKGWFMMTSAWFKEYVYQVVVPKSIVESKWSQLLNTEAVMLKPWDPMVSLPLRRR
ncbi:cysteine proteinase 1, mitochondrial [Kwoniella newhampshirensis]|uniref:Cysteine proteinase 1, mitochondrial n=1 Tax=Kwoniella newhampshirensis TaxID=1651941 RepID=A0AAW0YXS2_9TREE